MTESYVGSRKVLGIGVEGVRGAGATPRFFVKAESCGFETKVERDSSSKMIGTMQPGSDSHVVKKFAEGPVTFDVDDVSIGDVLSGVFGQVPVTTGETNKTHTFSVKESNQHQSLAFLKQDPNVSTAYALAMIDSLELNSDQNKPVKANLSMRSKAGVDGVAETPSYTNLGTVFIHADASIKLAADVAGLSAAVALDCLGITLAINKNIQSRPLLGSIDEQEITNGVMAVSGSFIVDYTDQTFRNYMLNNDYKAIQIAFSNGANNSLVFTIPKANFMWEPSDSLEDIITQSISFEADKLAGSDLISAVLKNQFVSYAVEDES